MRTYKAFGLTLMAMLVLGAFGAQGASALPLTVPSIPNGTVYLTGDLDGGHHVWATPGGSSTCTEVHYLASATTSGGAVNEITVQPNFKTEGCSAFGFAKTHVKANGCTYTFTTPTSIGIGQVTWSGSSQFHIVCPAGNRIEITVTSLGVSVCTQFIEEQTPTSGHVVGKNAGGAEMDVTLEYRLTGIHYRGNGGPCGNDSTHTDGTTTANSTVKCFSNEARTIQTSCTFS